MVVGSVVGHPQGTSTADCRIHAGCGQKAGVGAGQSACEVVLVIIGQESLDG